MNWISTDGRLPDNGQKVIATIKRPAYSWNDKCGAVYKADDFYAVCTGDVGVLWCANNQVIRQWHLYLHLPDDVKEINITEGESQFDKDNYIVTAWMPLPEPYKEGK